MKKVIALVVVALFGFASAQVTISWLVGLGTGANPDQQEIQNAVIEAFNASQDDIILEVTYIENSVSVETLSTLLATGQAPDIVGPVGNAGANAFVGNFLDIEPYLIEQGYDFSQFSESQVDFYRTSEGLVGLPLASFPAFIFYRPAHFDEAGLDYPPANYGDPYMLDGEELEWNIETMSEVAKILTVDANGNDATMDEFDASDIVQFGFANQWADPMRQNATLHGADTVIDADGNAVMSDTWREAFQWYYDAMWADTFMPNAAQRGSDLLASGNVFASKFVSMAHTHLWYTCCLEDDEWDAAALPSHNGEITSRLHADTFRIMNTTEHPAEAVEVLTYLTGEASLELLSAYGGLPAREADQPAFYAGLDEKYPQGVNWDIVSQSLQYPDIPSHEVFLPNNNRANDRLDAFRSLLDSEPGLDVNEEIDKLLADLQVIFDTADN
ncbi:MAG: extracellular solute-binding protein [Deinococcota bacterium]